jgi:hypothetical protein
MKQPPQKQLSAFIIDLINNDPIIYQAHNIGIAMTLGRGLGKICCS